MSRCVPRSIFLTYPSLVWTPDRIDIRFETIHTGTISLTSKRIVTKLRINKSGIGVVACAWLTVGVHTDGANGIDMLVRSGLGQFGVAEILTCPGSSVSKKYLQDRKALLPSLSQFKLVTLLHAYLDWKGGKVIIVPMTRSDYGIPSMCRQFRLDSGDNPRCYSIPSCQEADVRSSVRWMEPANWAL